MEEKGREKKPSSSTSRPGRTPGRTTISQKFTQPPRSWERAIGLGFGTACQLWWRTDRRCCKGVQQRRRVWGEASPVMPPFWAKSVIISGSDKINQRIFVGPSPLLFTHRIVSHAMPCHASEPTELDAGF